MKALIVIVLTAALVTHLPAIVTHLTVVAIVAGSLALVPLALVVGYRAAVMKSGVKGGGMCKRRVFSLGGKW